MVSESPPGISASAFASVRHCGNDDDVEKVDDDSDEDDDDADDAESIGDVRAAALSE